MRATQWMIRIACLYLLLYSAHAVVLGKTVYGDGVFYFSWVRSAVVDRNLNFVNEYAHFGVRAPITPQGTPGNKHPIGAPLLWLPWYTQAHMLIGAAGYEFSYQLIVGFVSVLAALAGLVLLFRLLTQWFNLTASVLAVAATAGATNLLFYGAIDPVNSHAVSFFATTVFLSFLYAKPVSPFIAGLALGGSVLVRPQDAILGLLALLSLKRLNLLRLIFGTLIGFSPQLLAWYALYGSVLSSPYLTSGESFSWWPNHFFDVLFSPTNGFFLWTPITLLAVVGLFLWKHPLRPWFLTVFTTEVAIVGSWSIWWQGASYSGRMLVSTLPLLAFGLAELFTLLARRRLRAKQILIAIIAPLSVLNILFIVRFLLQG